MLITSIHYLTRLLGDATIIIYGYTPSIVVGILGIVLFALAGVFHLWQLVKYRSWYFSTMMIGIAFVGLRFCRIYVSFS